MLLNLLQRITEPRCACLLLPTNYALPHITYSHLVLTAPKMRTFTFVHAKLPPNYEPPPPPQCEPPPAATLTLDDLRDHGAPATICRSLLGACHKMRHQCLDVADSPRTSRFAWTNGCEQYALLHGCCDVNGSCAFLSQSRGNSCSHLPCQPKTFSSGN